MLAICLGALCSNMWMYIHTYTTAGDLFSPLSVLLSTHTDKHMNKRMVADLFTQPFLPHSWPAASLIQLCCWCRWVGLLSGRSNTGGFITPSSKSSSPDWGPSGERGGVSERVGPAATHSLSLWDRMAIYLFTPYWIILAQSVEIIDLFGRRQSCPLQDIIQRWVKSPCHHLEYSDASHLLCNGLWHPSVIWANSEAAGARFAGCGPDGHEYGNRVPPA